MKIIDAYEQYKIMPMLQLHQLRVAGVAHMLCDALQQQEKHDVVTACLLHDMGNLIKMTFHHFPEAFEPEGVEFWATEQAAMKEHYGADEHRATIMIAQELGVSDRVIQIIDNIGFGRIPELLAAEDIACVLAEYADLRVAPGGVVSFQERLEEVHRRYAKKEVCIDQSSWYERHMVSIPQVEARLFLDIPLRPEHITEEAVAALFPVLQAWEL